MYNCCTHSFSYLYTNNMFNAYGILYNSNNVILKNSLLILETERLLSSTLKLVKYGTGYAKNKLGSKGRLAQNYAKFIKNMWC